MNQVDYPSAGAKVAYAMLPARVSGVSFTVSGAHGTVLRGRSAADAGSWNSRYRAVYTLPFSAVRRPGRYRITVTAAGQSATSPPFTVGAAGAQYGRLVTNAVRYFTSERDGGDVEHSVLSREPANLTDASAAVYASPTYDSNDNLTGKLTRIGGPVNVSGGWFDAGGGYEKFAYTASYADGLLQIAQRDFPGRYPTLGPEARFGLSWLQKLWNPATKTLYIQVGIGNGNASNTIQGDYNFWFLPQAEDRLDVKPGGNPGPTAYYVKYRPVFAAAPPGQQISPEFAGRFAADFGLAAQLRGPDRAAGRAAHAGAGPRHLRHGQDHPRGQDRHHVPQRLLRRHGVEERHALGRRGGGPGRRGAARAGRPAARRPADRQPVGAGLPGAGTPGRR